MHKKEKNILIRVEAYRGEPLMLRFLIGTLVLCIALYLYFIGYSIMNMVAGREATAESERLQSAVVSLEEDYFALTKGITPAYAAHFGLSETKNASYVRRAGGVALNTASDN